MDTVDEIIYETPLIRVFKGGRVERYFGTDTTPSSLDPATGVSSKDVVISPETGVSARLYIPKTVGGEKKLPVLVYFHGGGFCLGNAFNPIFHNYLNSLVAQANLVAVSVDYRLAPEHPVPAAYDDSWTALRWVAAHASGGGPSAEAWLAEHADFGRVFLAGESAGGNIAHHMTMRAGGEGLLPCCMRPIRGLVLIHPYFLGSYKAESAAMDPATSESLERLWMTMCPRTAGVDDPRINPVAEGAPSLAGLACGRVLVCVGGEDVLRDRGRAYYEWLKESGWEGEAEMYEAEGKGHTFHLIEPACEEASAQNWAICCFLEC